MKVLMLAPLQEEDYQYIKSALPEVTWIYASRKTVTQDMIDHCDVIVGNPGTRFCLNQEHIQAILLHSAGSEAYVQEGILHPHTKLANASGTFGKAIAEHVIGMILCLNKNIHHYVQNKEQKLWKMESCGKELFHQTVLIVGLGDLGSELAKRLKAFDCHIIAIKRTFSKKPSYVDELYTADQLEQVLPKADFIVSTLPQTKETIHLFNKQKFMLMKKDALFVNVGRGSAIKTDDLIEVLKIGHLYGAALDVFEEEPLPQESELWDFDNVIITPHCSGGYQWESARLYYRELVVRNIKHLLHHERLENEVDFELGYRKGVK